MENNYFKLFLSDIQKLWATLGLAQKFGIIVLITVTLVAASFFLSKATEPNWTVLYSELTEHDTAAIAESLRKNGYPFKLSSDKTAVLVPANMQEDLRLFVAENDLIQDSSPGFELLDQLQLGSTDFKNKLTKQRIFQGELTRTIEKLSGVRKARVQLAEPERSIFSDKDEAPTASVMLILEPGYRLKTNQITAIKNIVAYAVPRLEPDKVFITDQSGNNLTDEIQKSATDIESYRTNFEVQTAKKVQSVLEKITGQENATVQVSAEIDFNSVRATIESYLPVDEAGTGVLTSQQIESESYENPKNITSIPAVENITDSTNTQQATNTAENSNLTQNIQAQKLNYEKQRSATNYSVSKEIKQVIYAPGTVKRMTIAVALNKILTTQEKEELKNLVISASGANVNRGDIITITGLEFASVEKEQAQVEQVMAKIERQAKIEFWSNKVVSPLIILILGITALFFLRSFLQKIFVSSGDDFADINAVPVKDELDDMIEIEPLLQLEAKLDPELEKMKNDLSETIMADPVEASRLLVSYIKE